MRHKYFLTEQRSLDSREARLLEWLLKNGMAGAEAYLEQVPRVRVVSRCSCGCPTIDLALDGRLSGRKGPSTILADAQGQSPEGALIGVIVHAREDELSELEVYSIDGLAERFTLPNPEQLEPIPS